MLLDIFLLQIFNSNSFGIDQQKLMVPPNTSKKKLQNSIIVVKYLKQAGVSLCDADGTQILADDIANGDKELILCAFWNLFVSLQVLNSSWFR